MTNAEQQVVALLTTTEGQQQFVAWITAPCGQLILQAARERSRPRPLVLPPGTTTSEIALASLYHSLGANSILDYIATPVTTAKATDIHTGLGMGTYGAKLGSNAVEKKKEG